MYVWIWVIIGRTCVSGLECNLNVSIVLYKSKDMEAPSASLTRLGTICSCLYTSRNCWGLHRNVQVMGS